MASRAGARLVYYEFKNATKRPRAFLEAPVALRGIRGLRCLRELSHLARAFLPRRWAGLEFVRPVPVCRLAQALLERERPPGPALLGSLCRRRAQAR